MTTPRRYRVALLAYPAGYRTSRGPELAATLAEGDDERGRPSTREAAALAYRGLRMRGRAAGSPRGLLVAAALVLLVALTGGFTWSERVFGFRGQVAAIGSDAPGLWPQLALGVAALAVLAVGPLRALESRRRRRTAVLLSVPLALAIFTQPGRIFYTGLPDAGTIAEFLTWSPAAVYANWELAVPACIGSALGTLIALRALERLRPAARRHALGAVLVILSAVSIAQAWHRPDLPAEYARSAFADLGPATFMAATGLILVLAAMWGRAPAEARSRRMV